MTELERQTPEEFLGPDTSSQQHGSGVVQNVEAAPPTLESGVERANSGSPELTDAALEEVHARTPNGELPIGNPSNDDARPDPLGESLARLEMSSLEVKLYLDSIEQRISRMEPRLEELRDPRPDEDEPVLPGNAQDYRGTTSQVEGDESEINLPVTERRRKIEGVPVEKRRPPRGVRLDIADEEPWDWRASVQRRKASFAGRHAWAAVLCVGLVGLGGLLYRGSDSHSQQQKISSPVPQPAASTPVETAQEVGGRKSGASRPYSAGGGQQTTPGATANAEVAAKASSSEQGVLVPDANGGASASVTESSGKPSAATPEGTGLAKESTVPSSAPDVKDPSVVPPSAHGTSSSRVAASRNQRVNVSSGVMAGNLLSSRPPTYPKGLAGLFHTQGKVVMQAIISKSGHVENLRVISGHYMLRGAAKDAVRTWRYRPYGINGVPVEVATIISVEFHR